MEDLEEILQFTALGYFKRGTVYTFADYLGYNENVPETKVEFVQNWVKDLLVNKLSEMNIRQAQAQNNEVFQQTVQAIHQEVNGGVQVTMQTINNI